MTAYTTQHLPPSFVTIVIPIFGSVTVLQELVSRLENALINQCDRWEIILVEDGGPDENWIETARLATAVESVIGVRLSRNFGQQEAIAAGIAESSGDTIVVMDCDLQDPPECVGRLLDALREGADIAIGNRAVESAGPVRNIINHAYYWFLSRLSGYRIDPQQGTFSAIRRVVADSYLGMSDLDRPYRLVLDWLGFKVERIDFERIGRTSGASTYSVWRLMKFALSGVVFQSTRLLYASIVFGALTSGCAFLMGLYYIFNALRGKPPEGWASTIVVNLMLGGIILIAIGVMGVYVGKIFNQTRGRPMYIVRAKLGTRSSK